MKDLNGTEIVVGDKVVIAQRRGSSQWLKVYEVVDTQVKYGETRPVIEFTQTPRKTGKTHKVHSPYMGSGAAILVIGKVTSVVDGGTFTDLVSKGSTGGISTETI